MTAANVNMTRTNPTANKTALISDWQAVPRRSSSKTSTSVCASLGKPRPSERRPDRRIQRQCATIVVAGVFGKHAVQCLSVTLNSTAIYG